MPETEVLPHHDRPRSERHNKTFDELGGAHGRYLSVETHHPHLASPCLFEQVDPGGQVTQQAWCMFRCQHRQRMGPEGDDREFAIAPLGLQHALMPEMDSVEVTDGHYPGSAVHDGQG